MSEIRYFNLPLHDNHDLPFAYQKLSWVYALGRHSVLLFVLAYVFFQLMNGNQNLLNWSKNKHELIALQERHQALQAQKKVLDTQVSYWKNIEYHLDFLDEKVRGNLHMARPDEVIIWFDRTLDDSLKTQ